MITAKEADNLVFESVKYEYNVLEQNIERAIRIAAMDGRRSVIIPIDVSTGKQREAISFFMKELRDSGFYASYDDYGSARKPKWEITVSW